MRILDRERYWSFAKAYFICFVSLVGLYVVIDAFSNVDEFTKRASGSELFEVMGRYYLIHLSQYYDRLCGVIGMMAAIFTVTWMQKNNELLAILAAGVSTQRVIRPVLVSAVIVSGFAVVNQEVIMPKYANELELRHDDDGVAKLHKVFSRYDANDVLIHGKEADRASQTVITFNATLPVNILGSIRELEAQQARYIPVTDQKSPYRGGWLLRGARMSPPMADDQLKSTYLIKLTDLTGFPPPIRDVPNLVGDSYFLRSDIKFEALTRSRQWYEFAPTIDLVKGLTDPANEPEKLDIAVFLHGRILRPLSSLALLCLSLPLVLNGYGRNTFVSLALALGTAAAFHIVAFFSQYLGGNAAISPELAAWAPLIGFGTVAIARWDKIRT